MYRNITLSINNLDINITERRGKYPAIVFVHGNSESSRIWHKQFESELLKDYQLIAIDLPGHGKSSYSTTPEKDYNLPAYAEIVTHIIEKLELINYVWVGFSLGANIGLEALPNLQNCRGLFLLGCTVAEKPIQFDKAWLPNPNLNTIFQASPPEKEIIALLTSFYWKSDPIMPEILREDFIQTDAMARTSFGQSVAKEEYSDPIILLKNNSIPVAMVMGKHEQLINIDSLRQLILPWWKGDIQLIAEAGHLALLENPEYFNQLLADFVEDVTK